MNQTLSDVFHWGNHPNLWEFKTRKTGSKDGNETRLNQTAASYSFHPSSVTNHQSTGPFVMLLGPPVRVLNSNASFKNEREPSKPPGTRWLCLRLLKREVNLCIIAGNYAAVTVWALNINCLRLPPLCCWSPLNGTLYTDAICPSYLLSSHILPTFKTLTPNYIFV